MASFEPILPKKPVVNAANIQRKLFSEMKDFLLDTRIILVEYEAPPSLTYSRTFTLGKSWTIKGGGPRWEGRDLVGEVGSPTPYAIYVRGPRHKTPGQAEHMHRRGWKSVTEILAKEWPPQKRRFQAILRGG